jgi:hypothetical protein
LGQAIDAVTGTRRWGAVLPIVIRNYAAAGQFAARPVIYPCKDLECVVHYGGDLLGDVVGRAQIFSEEAHLAFEILL